jgi:hypothetical protein
MNFMIPLGNLYFKFGSEAGASAFLGLYISDLDNSVGNTLQIGFDESVCKIFLTPTVVLLVD